LVLHFVLIVPLCEVFKFSARKVNGASVNDQLMLFFFKDFFS